MSAKKTIWYLNHYAPSRKAPKKGRAFFLLNAVAQLGYKVAVVGASRHHLNSQEIDQKERFNFGQVGEVLFGWVRTPPYRGNGIKRILNMLSYAWQLLLLPGSIPASHSKPDVIVASSVHPFHYPIALWLAWRLNAKIIFEVRDIWPLTLHELMDIPKWHPFYLVTGAIERLAYRTADRVISLMGNGLEHMQSRGLKAERFAYIPNGIQFDECDQLLDSCDHDRALSDIRASHDFVLMYTGAHGVPNALDQLISAAEKLLNKPEKVALVLVGDGGEKEALVKRKADQHLENVFFLPPVPADHVPKVLSYADACFIGWQKKTIYRYGISANKLFEYMRARKPILQCIDSPKNPVPQSGCGIEVMPEEPEKLAEAVLELARKDRKELAELGERGYEYASREHNYKYLADRFVEACNV